MDILEFIRILLDQLGFDLFQIPDFLVTCRRRRSFVRMVGCVLPLGPARRARFQNVSLGGNYSIQEPYTQCANFGDVGHLEEISFVNGIAMRSELRPLQTSHGPRVSTPDTSAIYRINELEDELSKLRQQIATLVILQEQSLSVDEGAPGGPSCVQQSQLSTPMNTRSVPAPPPPPPTPLGGIPPPPGAAPPPPPPPPPVQTPKRSAIDLIKENRSRKKTEKTGPTSSVPDMSEVLKGIGNVRLRQVERSPGGTPVRRRAAKPQSPIDPASLIAHALRKKFARTRTPLYSPDAKASPDGKENSTPSPKISAPQLLKPSQLRNLRANARRRSSPLAADWE